MSPCFGLFLTIGWGSQTAADAAYFSGSLTLLPDPAEALKIWQVHKQSAVVVYVAILTD